MTLAAAKKPASAMGRRELVRSLAGLCRAVGCGPAARVTSGAAASAAASAGTKVALWSWFDFPDDPRSRELSGIAWDDANRTLWAIQDETANIVPIIPNADLTAWGFGPTITLRMSFPLDLEAIVVTPDGFLVASEKGPRILDVDRQGKLRRDLPLPAHFEQARDNKSLESLTMSPDGKWLFTTTEEALSCDGAQATTKAGTRVRVLRMTPTASDISEHMYTTDPSPYDGGDYGIADMCALSDEDVLVLERGWARGHGNTVRVYRASIGDARTSCIAVPTLEATSPTMAKELLVDLGKLPAQGLPTSKQPQASALLDNFEGLALGPRLRDGRQSLFLVSDDNARSDQVSRILVLALG